MFWCVRYDVWFGVLVCRYDVRFGVLVCEV